MRHPRERGLDRRDFLRRGAAAGLGLSSLGAVIAACGGGETAAPEPAPPQAEPGAPPAPPAPPAEPGTTGGAATTEESGLELARPDNPVTLPIFDDNPPIESGLSPEGGTLKVYNWIEYIWNKKLKDFEEEFGVKVELSTFYTMDEAVAKLATGSVDYDVFFPTPDRLGRLVHGKLCSRSITTTCRTSPEHLAGATRTLLRRRGPYTVPTRLHDGIGYPVTGSQRTRSSSPTPTRSLGQAYKGKAFLLDDGREAIAFCCSRTALPTSTPRIQSAIELAKEELMS